MKNFINKLLNILPREIKPLNKVFKPNVNNNLFSLRLSFYSYKKDYYLPLPKKVLFLPAPSSNKQYYYLPSREEEILTNISGLASISDVIRMRLKTDPIYFKTFARFMLTETCKILYYLFNQPFSNHTFINNIFKSFSLIYTKNILKLDKELAYLNTTRHLNTCQHIINIICHKFSIDIKTFNNIFINKNVDFTHYKNIPIGVLIEYFIFNTNMQDLILDNSINIKFINHENHMLDEPCDIFKTEESLKQTSQKHADLLFYKFVWDPEGIIKIIRYYRDIKADYKGTTKGHYTLIPQLHTDLKTAKAYVNNYTTYLVKKMKDNPLQKELLKKSYDKLIDIRRNIINNTEDIKILIIDFNQILLNISFDSENNKDLDINFTIASDVDIDNIFIKDILPIIEENLENHYDVFDIDIIFPRDNKINVQKVNQIMFTIIEKILPQPLRGNLHNNLTKFIENNVK